MKPLFFLLFLHATTPAPAEDLAPSLETNVFGLSYHFDRSKTWNETNPGVGVGLALTKRKEDPGFHSSFVIESGVYKDSYNDTAFFIVSGPRLTFGYENSFHATADLGLGFLHGSGNNGAAIIPTVGVGYDRLNLCVTADTLRADAVAVFLRFRAFTF